MGFSVCPSTDEEHLVAGLTSGILVLSAEHGLRYDVRARNAHLSTGNPVSVAPDPDETRAGVDLGARMREKSSLE